MRVGLVILLLISAVSLGKEFKYCIQAAAEKNFALIKAHYQRVKDFPEARIEKRGSVYLLRIGSEKRSRDLRVMLRKVRRKFPDAYIKRCEINPAYVVFPVSEEKPVQETQEKQELKREETKITQAKPEPKPMEEKPKEEVKTSDTDQLPPKVRDQLIEQMTKMEEKLEEIREKIEDMENREVSVSIKDKPLVPVHFEKFLYSVAIFIGGMFLFTWILLAMIYRRVGANNMENAHLLNDLFRLIKLLNILRKGNMVKMENGKFLVYDKNTDKWKEVD